MSGKNILDMMQRSQLEHDRNYHPDIHHLPTQRRVAHMVMHFAKYAGKFTIAKQTRDRQLLIDTLIDTFIICLVLSNSFNKRISDFSSITQVSSLDLRDIAKKLSCDNDVSEENIYSFLSENITIEAGMMAKAIESLDHLEMYPYNEILVSSLENIVTNCLISSLYLNIDLQKAIDTRLKAVEAKSIFHDTSSCSDPINRSL